MLNQDHELNFLVVELIRHFSNLNLVLIGVHVVKFTSVNFTFIRLEGKKLSNRRIKEYNIIY